MKLLKFLEYISESNSKLLPVVFSEEFKEKIENMDDCYISSTFRQLFNSDVEKQYTLISIGKTDDFISYIDSYKLRDYSGDLRKIKYDDDLWKKNRTETRVGRFIGKFFPNVFTDKAIEDFVNKWKSSGSKNYKFEIWSGSDIKRAYTSNNYHFTDINRNTLMNSCMNDEIRLISFYSYCPTCSVLVLLDDDNLILGRANFVNL